MFCGDVFYIQTTTEVNFWLICVYYIYICKNLGGNRQPISKLFPNSPNHLSMYCSPLRSSTYLGGCTELKGWQPENESQPQKQASKQFTLSKSKKKLGATKKKVYNIYIYIYMGVSKNRGTPKSSILIGFSIINHPFWGTPIFGNTNIYIFPQRPYFFG